MPLIKLSEIITIRQQADLISKVKGVQIEEKHRFRRREQQKCNNGIRLAELSGSTVWRSWFPNNKRHIPRLVNCAISMSNEVICEADRLLLRYAGGATRWLLPDKRDHSSSLSQRENNVASLERCPSQVNLQFSSAKMRVWMENGIDKNRFASNSSILESRSTQRWEAFESLFYRKF